MPNNPLITVAIPAFNAAPFILETLESVYTQSYKNIQLIVISDGSTDSTEDIVMAEIKKGKEIDYYVQKNSGIAATRNKIISICKGDFLLVLDSDDILFPSAITNLYEKICEQNADFVFSNYFNFGEKIPNNVPFNTKKHIQNIYSAINGDIRSKFISILHFHFSILPSGLLYRFLILKNLKFDEKMWQGVDYEFHLRLMLNGFDKFTFLDELTVKRRLHQNNLTNNIKRRRESIVYTYEKLLPICNLNIPLNDELYRLHRTFAKLDIRNKHYDMYIENYKKLYHYQSFFKIQLSMHLRALKSYFKK